MLCVVFYIAVCVVMLVSDDDWWVWFFFFKQKTAYEMRISDWSSDVCSSDLQIDERKEPQPSRLTLATIAVPNTDVRDDTIKRFVATRFATLKIGRASCRERVCQYV